MNSYRKKKLIGVIGILLLLSMGVALVLYALKQNINLFYTPTQLLNAHTTSEEVIRIGGYVKEKSVHIDSSGQRITFIITDHQHDVPIFYDGMLPNLFREGQGVVVTGKLNDRHIFIADQVLAKHDEKYMPWSLAKALKEKNPHGT